MNVYELMLASLFEGVSKDELIAKMKAKQEKGFIDDILKKMHELVQTHGERQSIGGYAFDVGRMIGNAIPPKEIERLYKKKYMNEGRLAEWGRVVKGVNTTVDVGPNEIKRQASKYGNSVDKNGFPPTMSTIVKGKSTTVNHHSKIKESETPRYTAAEWAIIEGGHSLEDIQESRPKKPGRIFAALSNEAIAILPLQCQVSKKNKN